ncbi:hypothetical protein BJV82DRAFT_602646 [Fennellomyces sp. T-0311]|nr:hypothetical protein BJV82DRAFT_602646 [Fennellomyces sp. T-0311]
MRGIIWASALLVLSGASLNEAASYQKRNTDIDIENTHHHFWARQEITKDITVCPLNTTGVTYLTDIYRHFGYIALDGKEFFSYWYPRPVAIRGDATVDSVQGIATTNPLTCTNASDINSYAFVHTGGTLNIPPYTPLNVSGNAFVDDSTSLIVPKGANCQVYNTKESIFDWAQVEDGLNAASKYLASLKPDLHLNFEHITSLGGQAHHAYQVFTLNSCNPPASDTTLCSGLPLEQLSDPSILFSEGDTTWNGPDNKSLYKDAATVVINVPLRNGSDVDVTTQSPSSGFVGCHTIFNFYPVDSNGHYYDGADAQITVRNKVFSGRWTGFFLGPKTTFDSSYVTAAGKFFMGTLYDDYKAHLRDFDCGNYDGCFPVEDIVTTVVTTIAETTTDETTTTETNTNTVEFTKVATLTHSIVTTSTTTEVEQTTTPIYVPIIKEDKKDKKWSGKDKGWSNKDDGWSDKDKGWSGKDDGWSDKGNEWSGKKGKWSEKDDGWYGKGGEWSGKDGEWSNKGKGSKGGKWSEKGGDYDDEW